MAGADRQVDGDGQPAEETPGAGPPAARRRGDDAVAEPAPDAAGPEAGADGPEAGADGPADRAADPEAEAAELIAQIRELAGPDPVAVRTVVAEVLAALDRVSGGTLREQLPYEHERAPDDDPAPTGDYPIEPSPQNGGNPAGRLSGNGATPGEGIPAAEGYPVEPHPVEPHPPEPHPAQPQPGPAQPGRPGPADPHPPAPGPAEPHPAAPHPTDPHPVGPRPADPHPAEPGPVTPGPIERRPAQRSGEDRT
ncbi:hypothetical protein [Plantactinospora sp. BB1]|uniref:hypothetical protein n=1 Tax=Plantactinospora sp. BB1 TaxID=2071627 RepID=UPI000D1576C2|nr:hypothetical protein [Plantactinospora sp. BB1]AVT39748.1 hypothetical protein C6W10_28560 [Plantactinospora sp. BB1]